MQDPAAASLATEALRSLIDAILVHPGERRGEVRLELRGDLAAFLRLDDGASPGAAVTRAVGWNISSGGMMGSLYPTAENRLLLGADLSETGRPFGDGMVGSVHEGDNGHKRPV